MKRKDTNVLQMHWGHSSSSKRESWDFPFIQVYAKENSQRQKAFSTNIIRAPSGLCGHTVFIKAKKESLLSVGRLAEILPEKITNWSSI